METCAGYRPLCSSANRIALAEKGAPPMKKFLASLLALMMLFSTSLATAEEPATAPALTAPVAYSYEELTVGTLTPLSGRFFTDMWGTNTADMDVRMLLHAYNLVEWKEAQGNYGIDDSVVSGLAVTADDAGNRVYTVALYEDLRYSDNTPVTAWDYAFSILLSAAPEVAAIGGAVNGANYILGIDAYRAGTADMIAGVRVYSDYQLSITVKAEYLPFFYELALMNVTPYPIHVIAPGCSVRDDGQGVYIQDGENAAFTAELLRETILNEETGYLAHPSVVSGPYVLTAYDSASGTASFALNPNYKGNSMGAKPSIAKLTVKPVSQDTMMDQLANGEIGLLNKVTNAEAIGGGMRLAGQGLANTSNYARSGYSFISFSCERPATASEAVRKAIALSFDKDAFIAQTVGNYGLRVDGYYGIGQWMYQLAQGTLTAPLEDPGEDATAEERAAYEEAVTAYAQMSMDNIPVYNLDVEAAARLLEEDGWTLNRNGGAFDPAADDVRCKEIDGQLVALELTMLYPSNNDIAGVMQTTLADNLKQIGVALTLEAKPFAELLRVYYRQEERSCDMIYMATNFAAVFDPSATFATDDAYQGTDNRTGIRDEALYDLAVDMRQCEPGDVLNYYRCWLGFQQRFAEVLPTIPVYSNVYFDFAEPVLQDYAISANTSWAQAIVGANLSDPANAPEETPGEDELIFE